MARRLPSAWGTWTVVATDSPVRRTSLTGHRPGGIRTPLASVTFHPRSPRLRPLIDSGSRPKMIGARSFHCIMCPNESNTTIPAPRASRVYSASQAPAMPKSVDV